MKNVVLAVFASGAAILVLFNGAAGTTGNQTLTALLTGGPLIALLLLGEWRGFRVSLVDVLFVSFVLTVVVSLLGNGVPATKETPLMAATLAAYPAVRLVPVGQWSHSFAWTTSLIVATGAAATGFTLYDQWDKLHGHPAVFGFDHAATVFLSSLSFLTLALASSGTLNRKRTVLICAALSLPLAIFAASQVRFTFVALAIALGCTVLLSRKDQRSRIVTIMCAAAVSIAAGLASQHDLTATYANYVAGSVSTSPAEPGEGTDCLRGETPNNSLAIRKALWRDALKAIPLSGWFGTGLSSFAGKTCVENSDPHNSILQASVEFGWLGGLFLSLMIAAVLWRLRPIAGGDSEARFIMVSFVFVAVVDLAHGHLSRDGLLFLFAAYSARLGDVFRKGIQVDRWSYGQTRECGPAPAKVG